MIIVPTSASGRSLALAAAMPVRGPLTVQVDSVPVTPRPSKCSVVVVVVVDLLPQCSPTVEAGALPPARYPSTVTTVTSTAVVLRQ
eukprot:2158700-Rhodomonas_salina.2